MKSGKGLGRYVYSSDMRTFDLDGNHSIIMSLVSLLISPVRITLRVMHNIMSMPNALKQVYVKEMLRTSLILELIGLVDFIVYKRWVLVVSQIPVILYAYRAKSRISMAVARDEEVTEVEIDTSMVEELCGTVYDDIDKALSSLHITSENSDCVNSMGEEMSDVEYVHDEGDSDDTTSRHFSDTSSEDSGIMEDAIKSQLAHLINNNENKAPSRLRGL